MSYENTTIQEILLPEISDENDCFLTIRGRNFSLSDLKLISECVKENFDKGRAKIAIAICLKLDWKQANGVLTKRACSDVLKQLEKRQFIILPPLRRIERKTITGGTRKLGKPSYLLEYDLNTYITELPGKISLELAKDQKTKNFWSCVIEQYHYLGNKPLVGRCLKYLVWSNDCLLGALAFSSPCWQLASRDSLLQLIGLDRANFNDDVINNSRFLILPNVKLKNLASQILSLATRQVVSDWKDYYAVAPKIAETFVQPSLNKGTCYKAANWIEIGLTKGYTKKGSTHHNGQEPKQIFLYGLSRKIRSNLLKVVKEVKTSN